MLYAGILLTALTFITSLLSIELGLPAAILEIASGVIAGNFLGVEQVEWVKYIAGFGGILLTFLAGSEVDMRFFREQAKPTLLLGLISFVIPFFVSMGVCRYLLHWDASSAKLASLVLSGTSLAVAYSVLIETGLIVTSLGKILTASTFVTNLAAVIGFSLFFMTPNVNTLMFFIVSTAILIAAPYILPHVVRRYGERVIEPEIKGIFFLLLVLIYFAHQAASHALLPAFVLGFVLSRFLQDQEALRRKLRVVAFAFITPIFFLNGGLNVSLPLVVDNIGLFLVFLTVKLGAKIIGVYPVAKVLIPREAIYVTLLMSTELTLGTIIALFGYQIEIINQVQFSILVAVIIASAVLPTFVAQRFFLPTKGGG